jgi:hypothetical protein
MLLTLGGCRRASRGFRARPVRRVACSLFLSRQAWSAGRLLRPSVRSCSVFLWCWLLLPAWCGGTVVGRSHRPAMRAPGAAVPAIVRIRLVEVRKEPGDRPDHDRRSVDLVPRAGNPCP